jgi:hypothetical protein
VTDSPSSYTPERPNSPTVEVSSEAQIDIKPTTNYSHVNSQNAAPEEEEFEQPQPRTRPSLPDPEDSPIVIDWNPDESYQTRFWNRIMVEREKRHQELLLIEQQRQQLEEERQQIGQVRSNIDRQKHDLQIRENKLIEYESLIPSRGTTGGYGITLALILPYITAFNEKAVADNIDLRTSANNLVNDIKEYRELGHLQGTIRRTEERIAALDVFHNQKQPGTVLL